MKIIFSKFCTEYIQCTCLNLQTKTPDVVDCREMRPFWISWEAGLIRAGTGNLRDENILLEWRDPEPIGVGLVAISTGFGNTGEWQFTNVLGMPSNVQELCETLSLFINI